MGSQAALLCLRFVVRDGLLRPYETGIRPLEVAVALRALHLPPFAHVFLPMALQSAIPVGFHTIAKAHPALRERCRRS